MARPERETAYFETDGVISHGYVGEVEGRRVTAEEAKIISAQNRKAEPFKENRDADIDAMKAKIAYLENIITELGKG